MHINCPHCHNGVEVVDETILTDVNCPSCGSQFNLVGDDPDQTMTSGHVLKTIGRFELVNEVGKGAFGSVWRGIDPQLDRTVAVKIPRKGQLNKKESEQFFREARAAAQLNHPNIVPVHEIGKDGETIYIVSEFVHGVSLADRLTAGQMGPRESVQLCIKVACALQHAHDNGVIHRDLKPGNIMLDDRGEPHVMDFGLAKREAGEMTMTIDGQILGTPAYMSPEQARGSAHEADGRSDVYSVGVILFKLLTDELPFRGNLRMLIHQVIHDEAPSPLKLVSTIDRDVATITMKCLEKDPEKRYPSAKELADDLQRYLDGKPINARPLNPAQRGLRWCKRKPALASALLLSIFLLTTLAIGGTLVAWQQLALKNQARDAMVTALAEKATAKLEAERANVEARRASAEAEKARLAEAESKKSAKRSADVLRIVTDSFRSANPEEGANAQMTAKDVLFHARESLAESDLDDLGRAELLVALMNSFLGVGEYEAAISTATERLAIYRSQWGDDDPDTLGAMNDLALGYAVAGWNKEAVERWETLIPLMKQAMGESHIDSLGAMGNLANCYFAMGRYEAALALREKTFALRTSKDGDRDLNTLTAMDSLAKSYDQAGRHDEALEIQEKTLAVKKEILEPEHPSLLLSMGNLALGYDAAGRFAEALEMRERTLSLRKQKLGEDHPVTLANMGNLALSYINVGRNEDALLLQEKTLALLKNKLPEDHPQTLMSMFNLSNSYSAAGRNDDALVLREKTLELRRTKLGDKHPDTLRSWQDLGASYYQTGRIEEALESFESLLDNYQSNSGEDHPDTQRTSKNLAVILRKSNEQAALHLASSDFAEAGYLWLAMAKHHGPHSDLVRDVPQQLHIIYLAQQMYTESLQSIDEWLKQLDPNDESDRPMIAWAKTSQSVCYLAQAKFEEAQQSAIDAIGFEAITDVDRQRCNSVIGACLVRQEKFDEAETRMSEACNAMAAMIDDIPNHLRWVLPNTCRRAVRAYELAGKPDMVKLWEAKLTKNQSRRIRSDRQK